MKLVHLVAFITKKHVTMQGHMNVNSKEYDSLTASSGRNIQQRPRDTKFSHLSYTETMKTVVGTVSAMDCSCLNGNATLPVLVEDIYISSDEGK